MMPVPYHSIRPNSTNQLWIKYLWYKAFLSVARSQTLTRNGCIINKFYVGTWYVLSTSGRRQTDRMQEDRRHGTTTIESALKTDLVTILSM